MRRLVGVIIAILHPYGWEVQLEVTDSIQGEHGSIDILARHARERALVVVEIKSELPGMDPLLRPLDAKVRLAAGTARERFGWDSVVVARLVVLPEDSSARRIAARHATVLARALPARSRQVRH